MKKILLPLLCVGIMAANSQTLSMGVKAGINSSTFKGSLFQNSTKSIVGFHAGGFLNLQFSSISLQPELLVSTAGARVTKDFEQPENLKITYIAIPVMLKINPVKSRFYAEAGPQAAIKISEKRDFNSFDFSLGIGLGYQSKTGLGAGIRYLAGLSEVVNFDDNTTSNFKNRVVQFGLSYKLGKK